MIFFMSDVSGRDWNNYVEKYNSLIVGPTIRHQQTRNESATLT